MIKFSNKVQNNFNRASASYDSVAKIQMQTAIYLVEKILECKNFHPKTILDLGTGTGYIPELLMAKYPQSNYCLNDIAEQMLDICKLKFAKHPNVSYLLEDMTNLNIDNFDLIISNFALQWTNNLLATLDFLNRKSSQIFAFSTLLNGTFNEWEDIINKYQTIKLHNYPTANELISFCNKFKHSFSHWIINVPVKFDDPLSFMHYLKSLGAYTSQDHMHFSNFKQLLKEQIQDLTVTYKIFLGVFNKQSKPL